MQLDQATSIAERVKAQIAPYCDRIEIAGSIRRRKADVGDIEIVAIPKRVPISGVFEWAGDGMTVVDIRFVAVVAQVGKRIKGHADTGKYVQVMLPEGVKLDLFTATSDNWGLIYAIRTGSADYSHHILACGWVRNGYKSVDGMLTRNCNVFPVREEIDLFRMAGVPWVEPQERDTGLCLIGSSHTPKGAGRYKA